MDLEPWHDFFLATAGAGSALAFRVPSRPLWALGVETVVVAGVGLLLAILSAGHIFRASTVKAGRVETRR